MRWFDRSFSLDLPTSLLPGVIERLRGTPTRLEWRLSSVSPRWLTLRRPDGGWSIQENAGHLLDLEALWAGRVDDLMNGRPVLRAADLTNQRTHEADHNRRPLAEILSGFRDARLSLVSLVETLGDEAMMHQAIHPRLGQPMRLVDHLTFVADHDDHHLAQMSALLREHDAE